jgi:rhamnulokinase
MTVQVLAIDLGAESGRVLTVRLMDDRLAYEEVHRFPNQPVYANRTLCWDILRLWHEISSAVEAYASQIASIGIDTWAEDFGLLDRDGNLLGNPVHYRDSRTNDMMAWVFERIPRRTVFDRTAIQFMQVNTLYQLASLVRCNSPLLGVATRLLMLPDLLHYWLCGSQVCEFTNATTTQFYNPGLRAWDPVILEAVGIPPEILPPVVETGSVLGAFRGVPVIAPATHDTGSAVVGAPVTTEHSAYLSSGTWSLLGVEVDAPLINDACYRANVTSEGGAGGKYRFLKNVMGLWIIQQCRTAWQQQGADYSYAQLAALAEDEVPFRSLIDPDDAAFLLHGNMPERIVEFCQRSHQAVPQTIGQVVRTVYESLALKYRFVFDTLSELAGRSIDRVHIIGGGSRNALLCQMTAEATGREVVAGPEEATALGNAIVQLIALGMLDNIADARVILARSVDLTRYAPRDQARWSEEYARFRSLLHG